LILLRELSGIHPEQFFSAGLDLVGRISEALVVFRIVQLKKNLEVFQAALLIHSNHPILERFLCPFHCGKSSIHASAEEVIVELLQLVESETLKMFRL